MRTMLCVMMLAACGEPRLVVKPLPPLVAPMPRAQVREIIVADIGLDVGEQWIWDVQVRGMSIGRIEMRVGVEEIESRFRTGALASFVASIEHDLITLVDRVRGKAASSSERVAFSGKVRQFTTELVGTTAYSFHTALGAIRGWASAGAPPGFLHVVHADAMFRVELAQPIVQQALLRVDGRVVGEDVDVVLTVWLDAARAPVRIEVRDGDDRVTAQLIDG
jgi:hypothetical protein